MERKSWTVEVGGTDYEVVLDWTYYGGRREVRLDGQLVDKSTVPMRWRSEQTFEIDGHHAVVRTKPLKKISPWFVISLEVDGRKVTPHPGTARWEVDQTGSESSAGAGAERGLGGARSGAA